jgi:hypothetical protein
MPRSCSANSAEKLFDADEHIVDLQQNIAKILFVTGLDPTNFENYEMTEIIASLRETFSTKNSVIGKDQSFPFTSCNYSFFVHKLRNAFLYLQISKYGKQL